jgi:type III pantothenate kinase
MKSTESLLVIDIGNSNVVLGVWEGGIWKHVWRLQTLADEESLEFYSNRIRDFFLEAQLQIHTIKGVVLSSVVPSLNEKIIFVIEQLFGREPLLFGPNVFSRLPLVIERPHEIGSDLVANALAAWKIFGKDMIVVDFGTALTFTSVTVRGEILGVSIAPGLQTALRVLFNNTAQLPEAPVSFPESVVGKDTVHAIQSGVLVGYVGLVRHMIAMIRAELGEHFGSVATGGLSSVLTPLKEDFDLISPTLTLDGLRLAFELTSE